MGRRLTRSHTGRRRINPEQGRGETPKPESKPDVRQLHEHVHKIIVEIIKSDVHRVAGAPLILKQLWHHLPHFNR